MSEEDSAITEGRLKLRPTLAKAGGEYADIYVGTRGALVTGYVVVFEVADGSGYSACMWLTGSGGEPKEEYLEGLPSWRVEGLVRKVLRDIHCENVADS